MIENDQHADCKVEQAIALRDTGNLIAAEQILRDILSSDVNHPQANYHLAMLMFKSLRAVESLPYFNAALEADPQQSQYWLSYISALIDSTHYEDAKLVLSYGRDAGLGSELVEYLEQQLELNQNGSSTLKLMSLPDTRIEENLIQLFSEKRYQEVEVMLQKLLEDYPDWLHGWKILSDTLLVQKKDARAAAFRALELNSNDSNEHCYYGLVLKSQGDLLAAAEAFQHAIQLRPDYAAAYNNLGIVSKDMGDVEAGIRYYHKALEINPGYVSCYSNLLFCLSHSDIVDTKALYKAHWQFGQQYESIFKNKWPKHHNKRDTKKVLQVGFVSADFREHSLASFFEPVLNHLAISEHLSLHAYAASGIEDAVTQRLHSRFHSWSKVEDLDDQALAEKIIQDKIDILVDLDGHTAGNRLLTFAMKPAPILVSWLGYLSTTGLTAIDYYLADSFLLPPKEFDDQFTEKIVQLPANAPFTPSELSPSVSDLPAFKNGFITFASFNRIEKISPSAVLLWSKLLKAVPNSKLLLGAMPQQGSYQSIVEWFMQQGINVDRLIFYRRSSMQSYLQLHYEVDICLDTFPSNGVTTTCHAAWMGVPTLCVEGQSLTSRGAMAIMQHLNLQDFIAQNHVNFVNMGIYWSEHLHLLADVRATLRERFSVSVLNQPKLIANSLETALRRMWHSWCQQKKAKSFFISK